jgi:hypothetical protein
MEAIDRLFPSEIAANLSVILADLAGLHVKYHVMFTYPAFGDGYLIGDMLGSDQNCAWVCITIIIITISSDASPSP